MALDVTIEHYTGEYTMHQNDFERLLDAVDRNKLDDVDVRLFEELQHQLGFARSEYRIDKV
jgi:translation elongation factor EF-4